MGMTSAEKMRAKRARDKAKADAERAKGPTAIITSIIPPDDRTPPTGGGTAAGQPVPLPVLVVYSVREGVERELVHLGQGALDRTADTAAALKLADIIDDDDTPAASRVAAVPKLKAVLDDLRTLKPAAVNPLQAARDRLRAVA